MRASLLFWLGLPVRAARFANEVRRDEPEHFYGVLSALAIVTFAALNARPVPTPEDEIRELKARIEQLERRAKARGT